MRYQTRAECLLDVTGLMEHVPMDTFAIESEGIPNVAITFTSEYAYDAIQAAMLDNVPDSHVMRRCLFVYPTTPQKTYRTQDGIGRAKYTVSFHDGHSAHNDGSPFFDMKIFSNKRKRDQFLRQLSEDGYVSA